MQWNGVRQSAGKVNSRIVTDCVKNVPSGLQKVRGLQNFLARRHFIDPVKKSEKFMAFVVESSKTARKAAKGAAKSVSSAFEPSFSDPGCKY